MSFLRSKIVAPLAVLVFVGIVTGFLRFEATPELDMFSVSVVAPISQPSVGESPIKLLVLDAEGVPVTNLQIEVQGTFLEAASQTVIESGLPEPEAGIYAVPFYWQHPGLWEVEVKLADAEGQFTKREFVFMAHDTTWICGFDGWEGRDTEAVVPRN